MSEYDDLLVRCPRLGHELTFAYCRREGGTLPCPRVVACWSARFPVADHLRAGMPEQDWERFLLLKPKEKVASLLEIIDKAKRGRMGKPAGGR
jgi:hypothetical protein